MRVLRISLLLISCACLAGWWILHRPYSPSQDLPLVSLTAFEVNVPSVEAGNALARAARLWNGVTAASYNAQSGLVAVSHTQQLTINELQGRLQVLLPHPVSQKIFPEPTGPKCPVPMAAVEALPLGLLLLGMGSGLTALLLFAMKYTAFKTFFPH